ncbi:peptide ABC transporter substrate-binding protein [Gemmatimonadota bacterium]
MSRRQIRSTMFLLLLSFWTSSCGQAGERGAWIGKVDPPESPVLRVAGGEDPTGLDPTRYSDQDSWRVARMLFEGLLAYTSDAEIEPGVAERWTVNDDATIYTFHLREDARWSDGSRVTASDFVFSWQRVLDPAFGAETAENLYPIKGARAINEGLAPPGSLAVVARSDILLEVQLEYPDPDFPSRTALPPLFPVPEASVSGSRLTWPEGDTPVGNGPFVLSQWRLNDRLEVERNPWYWNREAVMLEGVTLFLRNDPSTNHNLYLTGAVDWTTVNAIPTDLAKEYLEAGRQELHVSTVFQTYYLELNTNRPPLDDLRIRRALELVVPREEIAGSLFGTGQIPSRHFVSADLPDWDPPVIAEGDLDMARRLLAEAGYPGGEGLPDLIYLYNILGPHGDVAEYLQGVWQRELGITVDLAPMDFQSMLERSDRGDFDFARSGWLADLPSPISFLEVFEKGNPNNPTGWSDTQFDLLLEQARRTPDRQQRYVLLATAEERLLADVPIIPILQNANVQLIKPYVTGLRPNALDVVGWTGVRIETDWISPW